MGWQHLSMPGDPGARTERSSSLSGRSLYARSGRRRLIALLVTATVLAASTPVAPTPAAATPSADPSGSAQERVTPGHPVAITLITGDRVLFDPGDPGGPIIDGLRPGTTYETYRRNGHWFVLPAGTPSARASRPCPVAEAVGPP